MRFVPAALLLSCATGCSILAHTSVGYSTRPTEGQHGVVVSGVMAGGWTVERVWVGEQTLSTAVGVGPSLRGRVYSDRLGMVEFAPQVYGMVSRRGPGAVFTSLSPYVGPAFHTGGVSPVFSPTLQLGGVYCFTPDLRCGFLSAFTGYDLIPEQPAWTVGLQIGYGVGGIADPDRPKCLTP